MKFLFKQGDQLNQIKVPFSFIISLFFGSRHLLLLEGPLVPLSLSDPEIVKTGLFHHIALIDVPKIEEVGLFKEFFYAG